MTDAELAKPHQAPIRRDWLSKSIAGVTLGFTLAIGCSGLLLAALSGLPPPLRAQFAMWLVVPLWFALLAACYALRSGMRAWLWLGGGNLIVFGLTALLHHH